MKDPAFLFYSSDFLSGTMLMTDEELGKYIRLLCLQHQQGYLSKEDIDSFKLSKRVLDKFKIDENGNYFNERLSVEITKRKAYSESRRQNRKKKETYEKDMKKICNSYEEHMENENVIVNENINNKLNNKELENKRKVVNDSCVDDLQAIAEFYNSNVGQLTPYGLDLIKSYVEEMGKDLIIYAMQISVEANKRTIQYIKAILNNWQKAGIKTVAEAQKENGKRKSQPQENLELIDLYEN